MTLPDHSPINVIENKMSSRCPSSAENGSSDCGSDRGMIQLAPSSVGLQESSTDGFNHGVQNGHKANSQKGSISMVSLIFDSFEM